MALDEVVWDVFCPAGPLAPPGRQIAPILLILASFTAGYEPVPPSGTLTWSDSSLVRIRNLYPFPTSPMLHMKLNYFLVPILAMLGLGELRAQSADSTPSPSPEHGQQHHWRHHHAWIWKKLNLTDMQKTQIKSIRQDLKSQTRPALAAVMSARLKLRQDIDANSSDSGTIAADSTALATAVSQFATVRARELTRIKAVLTQDQLTTLSDFQKKREARMQGWINKLNQPTS